MIGQWFETDDQIQVLRYNTQSIFADLHVGLLLIKVRFL